MRNKPTSIELSSDVVALDGSQMEVVSCLTQRTEFKEEVRSVLSDSTGASASFPNVFQFEADYVA